MVWLKKPAKMTAVELVRAAGPDPMAVVEGDMEPELYDAIRELVERVEAVLKLHPCNADPSLGDWCWECERAWPCATVRALDGGESE